MMKSVRLAFRIFNRKHLKQHRFTGGLNALQSNHSHPQMGYNNSVGNDLAANYAVANGFQGHVANAIGKSLSNNAINVYEGCVSAGNSGRLSLYGGDYFSGGFGCGALAHDGSYKLFKWDNAQACMVPYESSISLKQRFQRSFAAFLRAWRQT